MFSLLFFLSPFWSLFFISLCIKIPIISSHKKLARVFDAYCAMGCVSLLLFFL
jgi:hypothetical protein